MWCILYPFLQIHDTFTLMTMSYLPRAGLLEGFIKAYETCPGVGEILVVWNGEQGLDKIQHLEQSRKVRIRVEPFPSMNNRYKPDGLIRNRGVLSLDDDLRIPCTSLHIAFQEWKRHPERLVGWFPRFIRTSKDRSVDYLGEPDTIRENRYNMILTGAAFIDSNVYFNRYWSPDLGHLRALVDAERNCDDMLMNFVVASRSCGQNQENVCQAVHYLRPLELIDLSHSSGVGISHDEDMFIRTAEKCLDKYIDTFGMPLQTETFAWNSKNTKPDCDTKVSKLFCSYQRHSMN